MNKIVLLIFGFVFICACNREQTLFKNKKVDTTGIVFNNKINATDELNILDYLYFYNGGGVAVGDINNDGLPDIYFTANQSENALYLNKGNWQFEDITDQAGVAGKNSWDTGTVMADVNNDGFLDIYTCAVVGINGFEGHNQLFINNGDNTFTEKSAAYGLDFDTFSSTAAFFDYDLDGDLDMYLLNHAVHTQNSFGKASLREQRNYEAGDRLMRNDGHTFTDVSEEAGIYGGINSYGLGLAISDFNKDGYPDIYVGNDFHEDDYYYLNQGDGTFKESLRTYFGHITRFSMGNDVSDINRDGWPDLMTLDMLPQDESVLKSTEGDDNFQTLKLRTERFGYYYQYTRNMLHINQKKQPFMETALLSGVAATDWSWSVLIEDYNQDGHQDMFISNGIPKRPNDLDFIRFVSSEKIKNKINQTKLVDKEALNLMPSGKVHNYIFEGTSTLKFNDKSGAWMSKDALVSGATAFGDFDNDGDLDLVINNLNSQAGILENLADQKTNYLKLKFTYTEKNPQGIGTKVYSYHNEGTLQFKELFTSRGFQASSQPIIHFGYGNYTTIDSLRIIWPNGTPQLVKELPVNQDLTIPYQEEMPSYKMPKNQNKVLFTRVSHNFNITYTHKEDSYVDFHRQPLIPFKVSESGPAVAVGDLNEDGKEDLFFGSSKYAPSQIYIQTANGFELQQLPNTKKDSITEDVSAVISDFNNDQKNDIFIATGGADFSRVQPALLDRVLLNKDSLQAIEYIKELNENASVVIANDVDGDNDTDVFIGNHVVTNNYGEIPMSYVLYNHKGAFSKDSIQKLPIGMVTHAIWSDFDQDGIQDIIAVGEWMPPVFLKNENGKFARKELLDQPLNGLWQAIIAFDIDQDGDQDYLLGNWGHNTKLTATAQKPLMLYHNDFDKNGINEPVIAHYKQGGYYPITSFDELSGQMPHLRKKYPAYRAFAGKTVEEIFGKKNLKAGKTLKVHTLSSGYLENNAGKFRFIPFGNKMQIAPIKAFLKSDFDGDTAEEVLAAGNFFGVTPYHGRFDTFPGALIKNPTTIISGNELGLDVSLKSTRHLNLININNTPYLLITFNNQKPQIYAIENE